MGKLKYHTIFQLHYGRNFKEIGIDKMYRGKLPQSTLRPIYPTEITEHNLQTTCAKICKGYYCGGRKPRYL